MDLSNQNTLFIEKPKIINISPTIYRDKKKLIIFNSPNELNEKLMRFHTCAITNLETYDVYSSILKKPVHLLLTDPKNLDERRLIQNLTKYKSLENYFENVSFFVITEKVLDKIINCNQKFKNMVKSIIILENIHEHFQYLSPWDGSFIDAVSILSIIQGICSIQMNSLEDNSNRKYRDPLQTFSCIQTPPEFWICTQFYKPKEKTRELEINETLRKNIDCEFIDKIVIFLEKDEYKEDIRRILAKKSQSALQKILFVQLSKRLSYSDFFKYISSSEVPENIYVALTNADIYFDNSIGIIYSISMENRMLALLRYEHSDDGPEYAKIFGPRPDSQDTWIFSASTIKSRKWTSEQLEKFNYCLGIPGCDNIFTTDMIREKFLTVNCSGSIRTYHYHSSQIRNYSKSDILWRPIYIYVAPTMIMEIEHVKSFSEKPFLSLSSTNSICIKSNNEARAQTYCTMLSRGHKYIWNVGENQLSQKLNVYQLSNIISNSNGILFDNYKLYVGNQNEEVISPYFRSSNIQHLQKTVRIENLISIPVISHQVYDDFRLFATEYLAPLLYVLKNLPKEHEYSIFWPEKFNNYLNEISFDVRVKILPVIPQLNFYSEKCWAIMPGSYRINIESTKNLRTLWKGNCNFQDDTQKMLLVCNEKIFCSDDAVFENELTSILERWGWDLEIIRENGNQSEQLYKLSNSRGIIFWNNGDNISGNVWRNSWLMPEGSSFLEFQNEFKLCGEAQEMAAACRLDSRIFILQKADDKYLRGLILKYIEEYVKNIFDEKQSLLKSFPQPEQHNLEMKV